MTGNPSGPMNLAENPLPRSHAHGRRHASVVALEACIDGTHVQVKKGEAVVGSGRAIRAVYFFERDAGLLKIADLQGREVAAC